MNALNYEFIDIVELDPPMVSNCDSNIDVVATSAMASHSGCRVIFDHMYTMDLLSLAQLQLFQAAKSVAVSTMTAIYNH